MIGKTISHYKILEKLGGGGMGIVYKAQDLKLDRFVALKFLPPYLSTSEDEKQRFIHEAKAASALDHSNICTIFEIGETKEGQLFIAMAYYEGETLKQKIAKRPLPLKEVVDIASQIATGLSKAHEAGIIHRDIKPANIIVTKEGEVKIVDFGLAKLTGQTKLTKPGSTLGTISYMSPEQLRGEKTDSRSDIWSLGVVIYEMVTGQLPFKGDYEQAITYAILNEEPEPITALRTGVPLALEGIIIKALAKDPKQRYQHVDEIPVDLQDIETKTTEISRLSTGEYSQRTKEKRFTLLRVIPWITTVLFASIAIIAIFQDFSKRRSSVRRAYIVLPESAPLDPLGSTPFRAGQTALAISPDGIKLVYVANIGEKTQLYLHRMDEYESVPIPGTEGAYNPFFSPDGNWIGFFSKNTLQKVPISGGAPTTLCEVTLPCGASWGPDDVIIFPEHEGTTLSWISADGVEINNIGMKSWTLWPEILPNGKSVLANEDEPSFGIKVIFTDTGEEKIILEGEYSNPKYLRTGHLMYETEGRLEVRRFDSDKMKVTGPPIQILGSLRVEPLARATQCAVSQEGTLVYISGGVQGKGQLVWVNRLGKEEALPFPEGEFGEFQLSPNGKQLAITVKDAEQYNVYVYDLENEVRTKLTFEGNNTRPVWTVDGDSITFSSDRNGYSNLFMKRADGSGDPIQITQNTDEGRFLVASCWSPDGKVLAIVEVTANFKNDILLLKVDNKNKSQPYIKTEFSEWGPVFSPDGRMIAYTSDDQNKYDVYVDSYPEKGKKKRISTENGLEPIWSPLTQELIYWTYGVNTLKWMAISYTESPTSTFGKSRLIFEGDYVDLAGRGWDISPDGQRILVVRSSEKSKRYTHINVIYNLFEELKSKFEAGN